MEGNFKAPCLCAGDRGLFESQISPTHPGEIFLLFRVLVKA